MKDRLLYMYNTNIDDSSHEVVYNPYRQLSRRIFTTAVFTTLLSSKLAKSSKQDIKDALLFIIYIEYLLKH